MIGSRRTALTLLAALAGGALAASAANETPKKTNGVVFIVMPGIDKAKQDLEIEVALGAERYSLTRYRPNAAPKASLSALSSLGKDKDYAVLVIATHTDKTGIVVETFNTANARNTALAAYRKDKALKEVANHISAEQAEDSLVEKKLPAIGIDKKGLEKLFGGADPNRSILIVGGCLSMELTEGGSPFGNTEFVGYKACVDTGQLLGGAKAGLRNMGGNSGILKRPVAPAFVTSRVGHLGPGNTTLAPAVPSDPVPAPDSILPAGATAGSTSYETEMRTSEPLIMEASGCNATLQNQVWTSNVLHQFQVTIQTKGMLILKAKDDAAVSKNNLRNLIGNRFRQNENYTGGENPQDERLPVDKCPFATSGLDSFKKTPPADPYRWCVWCIEKSPSPTPDPRESGAVPSSQSMAPRDVAWGETLAFVWYQDSPGPNTLLSAGPLPANFSFQQVGDWYAHALYTPSFAQLDDTDVVVFQSEDTGGVRETQSGSFTVVDRVEAVRLFDPETAEPGTEIATVAIEPGETADYTLRLANTGNTKLANLTLSPSAVTGPDTIPAGALTITPAFVDLLLPGESLTLEVSVASSASNLPGSYTGSVEVGAATTQGGFFQALPYPLELDHPATLDAPTSVMPAQVGQPLSLPLHGSDPDGDAVEYSILRGPDAATLDVVGPPDDLLLAWQPGPDDTGLRIVTLEADDGVLPAFFSVAYQVEGPAAVSAFSVDDDFVPDTPIPLEILSYNANTQPAQVFVSIEVFEGGFGGAPVYSSGELALGTLAADGEQTDFFTVPAQVGLLTDPYVRVTLRSVVAGNTYLHVSEIAVLPPVPSVPALPYGPLALLGALLLAGGLPLAAARSARRLPR